MRRLLCAALSGSALATVLAGCSPQFAYQVFETRPETARAPAQPALDLTYDFWHPDGYVGAVLTNPSAAPVYVDLTRAHLIVNGQSYDYYSDSETTTSSTVGRSAGARRTGYNSLFQTLDQRSAGVSVESSTSMQVRAKTVIELPPGAHRAVRLMPVVGGPVNTCALDAYDRRKNAVATYDSASTPLRFRLYFTYSRQPDLSAPEVLDFGFRVEKITAMLAGAFFGARRMNVDPCSGKKLMTSSSAYPFAKPTNLYVAFPLTGL